MTIVLPILFFAVGVGLFARRVTPPIWCITALWVTLVIAYHYLRH